MQPQIHTHYDNLKVARNAPPEVIRAAYKALAQRYHPDLNHAPDASRVMKILNDSYSVLSDPKSRAEHDRWIAEQLDRGAAGQYRSETERSSDTAPTEEKRSQRTSSSSGAQRSAALARATKVMRYATRAMQVGVAAVPIVLLTALLVDRRQVSEGSSTPPVAPSQPSASEATPAAVDKRVISAFADRLAGQVGEQGWSEIARSDKYLSLTTVEKDSVRTAFFERVIAPQVDAKQRSAARELFDLDNGSSRSGARSFDYEGARNAGYTDSQILNFIEGKVGASSGVLTQWSPNGKPWPSTAGYVDGFPRRATSGLSTLKIDNSSGASAVYLKLCSAQVDPCDGLRHVFIPAGQSFTIHKIAPGMYDVRFRSLDTGAISKSEPIQLQQSSSNSAIRYTEMQLTLYRVLGGNATFSNVQEERF